MSYDISRIEIVHAKDFTITPDKLETLRVAFPDAPESSVLARYWADPPPLQGPPPTGRSAHGDCTRIIPFRFWWHAEGSGQTFDDLLIVLANFDGEADLVLTWEGGDSFTGLRLRDHRVTKHDVVMSIGEEQHE